MPECCKRKSSHRLHESFGQAITQEHRLPLKRSTSIDGSRSLLPRTHPYLTSLRHQHLTFALTATADNDTSHCAKSGQCTSCRPSACVRKTDLRRPGKHFPAQLRVLDRKRQGLNNLRALPEAFDCCQQCHSSLAQAGVIEQRQSVFNVLGLRRVGHSQAQGVSEIQRGTLQPDKKVNEIRPKLDCLGCCQ